MGPSSPVNMPAGCIHNNMTVQSSLRQQHTYESCADTQRAEMRLQDAHEGKVPHVMLTHITIRAHTVRLHALPQPYLPHRNVKQRQPSYLCRLKLRDPAGLRALSCRFNEAEIRQCSVTTRYRLTVKRPVISPMSPFVYLPHSQLNLSVSLSVPLSCSFSCVKRAQLAGETGSSILMLSK